VRLYAHAPAPLARHDHQQVCGEGVIAHQDRDSCLNPQAVAIPRPLLDLLAASGPSGHEEPAAAVWRAAAREFADVHGDTLGTSFARVGSGSGFTLAVVGHIDEIGLAVTHVGSDGLLSYGVLGGFEPEILAGQRVVISGRNGPLEGVAVPRMRSRRDRGDRGISHDDVHIDIGAASGEEAGELVAAGDTGVWHGEPLELPNGRLVSKALDNRLGAYVALESARRLSEGDPKVDVVGVASVQEETGHDGARTAAFALEPDVALVIDVTYTTDVPGGDPKRLGQVELGSGAAIVRGPVANRRVSDLLVETAEAEGIPYAVEVWTGSTHSDADAVHATGRGIPTGIVSIPLRYMHSPCEMAALDDLEAVLRLVVAFAARLTPDTSFLR
jgi:putative aminopeptidase FrvX